MASSGIKITLTGFDELIAEIEKAGGSIDRAVDSTIRQSAQIMQAELKAQMQASGVKSDLISRMPPPKIEKEGNITTARVGYEKGDYDPDNLSDGYKIVFLNYGTPRRKKHGKVTARGFIKKANKKAKPQIKRAQRATLEKILGGLSQ